MASLDADEPHSASSVEVALENPYTLYRQVRLVNLDWNACVSEIKATRGRLHLPRLGLRELDRKEEGYYWIS